MEVECARMEETLAGSRVELEGVKGELEARSRALEAAQAELEQWRRDKMTSEKANEEQERQRAAAGILMGSVIYQLIPCMLWKEMRHFTHLWRRNYLDSNHNVLVAELNTQSVEYRAEKIEQHIRMKVFMLMRVFASGKIQDQSQRFVLNSIRNGVIDFKRGQQAALDALRERQEVVDAAAEKERVSQLSAAQLAEELRTAKGVLPSLPPLPIGASLFFPTHPLKSRTLSIPPPHRVWHAINETLMVLRRAERGGGAWEYQSSNYSTYMVIITNWGLLERGGGAPTSGIRARIHPIVR